MPELRASALSASVSSGWDPRGQSAGSVGDRPERVGQSAGSVGDRPELWSGDRPELGSGDRPELGDVGAPLEGWQAACDLVRGLLSPASLDAPSAAQWQAALPVLHDQRLAPFVYAQLRRAPTWRELPPFVQQELGDAFQRHSVRAFLLDAELDGVVAALAAAQVDVLLLKGAALGRTVYASTAERPAGDLDLLVRPEQVTRAQEALHDLGYRGAGLRWLPRWQRRYRAELPMLRQTEEGARVLVELHWALVEAPFYIDAMPLDQVWRNARPAADLPGALLPDPATLLIHCCAHLALHHSQEMRLFWLLDVDRLARWPDLDWEATLAQAERWRLDLAVSRIVARAAALFGTPLPPRVADWLARPRSDAAQHRLWGVGDEGPGRAWRRARVTWAVADPSLRRRYAAWLALRSLLWAPEQLTRTVMLSRRRRSIPA